MIDIPSLPISTYVPTLRICGLSNPEGAGKRAKKALGKSEHLGNILSRFSEEAFEIIGGKNAKQSAAFSCTNLLIASGNINTSYFSENRNTLFSTKWYGYTFSHFFLSPHDDFYPNIGCIEIDANVVGETKNKIDEKTFRKFENALGMLMSLMNHDATTHKYGVFVNGDLNHLNHFLIKYLGFGTDLPKKKDEKKDLAERGEIAAATFHRDMFEEIDELGNPKLPLKKIVLHNAQIILEILSGMENINLRKYWESVLKYPLFSLIDPEGSEIKTLRENFPQIQLNPTDWGKLVHRKTNNCSLDDWNRNPQKVELRKIRKYMMQRFYYQDEGDFLGLRSLLR